MTEHDKFLVERKNNWRQAMKYILIILALFIFLGCEKKYDDHKIQDISTASSFKTAPIVQEKNLRFKLEKVQSFRDDDAYTNFRDVFILTDTETNKTYVGISGVGISELGSHQNGKVTKNIDEKVNNKFVECNITDGYIIIPDLGIRVEATK